MTPVVTDGERAAVIGDDAPEVLLVRDRLGWATARTAPEAGLAILRSVRDRRLAVLGHDHPHTLTSEYRVAWAPARVGDHPAALTALEHLEPRITGLMGALDPQTLRVRIGRAHVLRYVGRAGDALALARDVHRAQLEVQGPRAVGTLRAAEEVGLALAVLGDRATALSRLRAVLAVRREWCGEEHRDTAHTRRRVQELSER